MVIFAHRQLAKALIYNVLSLTLTAAKGTTLTAAKGTTLPALLSPLKFCGNLHQPTKANETLQKANEALRKSADISRKLTVSPYCFSLSLNSRCQS